MRMFIKTERFTSKTINLSHEKRQNHINKHKSWVMGLNKSGVKMISGYLVDKQGLPGGGGLLIIEAKSFNDAENVIKKVLNNKFDKNYFINNVNSLYRLPNLTLSRDKVANFKDECNFKVGSKDGCTFRRVD